MSDISIIVPIYNAEKYLNKCLDSLLNQTKKELEFVLINDGSTDKTDSIIKSYNDKRIKYFKNKNQGIGKTRNFGISKSSGKYIMFLDSDDYLREDACEILYQKALTTNSDLVICDFYKVYDSGKIEDINLPSFTETTLKKRPTLINEVNLAPWNKIYKRELITKNNLKFVENLKYEDAPFVIDAFINAKKIAKVDEKLNYYVIHGNSETTVRDKRCFDILKIIDLIRQSTEDKKYLQEEVNKLTVRIITNYTIQQRNQKDKRVGLEFIDTAFSYLKKEVPDYKKNKYFKNRSFIKRTIEKSKLLTKLYCKIYKKKNIVDVNAVNGVLEMKKYTIGFFRKCDMLTMTGTTIAFLGMICAFKDHFTLAAFCLLLCGICDSFDGTLARKYKYSKEAQEYGVQLDSLSDVICFGLLPAIITILISNGSVLSTIICIYYMLCGVIRLAYFNMLHATKTAKKGEYVGLPITTAAFVYPVVLFLIRLIKPDLLNIILPIILLCMGTLFIGRFKFKKPNIKKIISTLFNKYTINLIFLPLFIVISGDIFYRTQSLHLFTILKQSIFVIANHFIPFIFIYLLITLIFIIINSLTNRSGITKIILLLLSLIIFIISDIKLNIMGIPIELSDISYLNPDNMGMMATATTTIGSWIWLTIAKGILFLALIIGIIYLDKFSKLKIEKLSKRLTALAITTVAFTLIIILMVNKNTFVINKIYGTNKESLYQYASVDSFTEDFGFFQGIILSSLSKRELVPDGYDAAYVEKLLEKYDNQKTSGEWKKANVVFLLSESFSDLENIDEVTFDKPLMSELDSYAKDKDKMVFNLLVPIFGGGSVNTEFEILTGASMSFWSPGFIPYNQYYKGTTGKDAPNIIKEFNNNGYTTMYLTPWGETSFNSKKNYEIFGATKTIYGTDLKGSNKGIYYSDKSLMEDIYNELKDTSEGNYKFIMAATAQNHFPFSKDKYDKYDINVKNTTYSAEDTALLRSYAQGIYDASKELNNLYQMIKKLDVPTIIVFFGDHLPYIIDSHSSQPYLESSYFTSPDKTICNLREYTTKAAILSNYDIKTDDIEYMNANYLGAYVLNKLDLNISSYFKYVEDMRKKIQAFNRQGLYQNNEIIPFDNTDKIIQEAIKSYKYVQYKSFYEISK